MGLDRSKLSLNTKDSKPKIVSEKKLSKDYEFKLMTKEEIEKNQIKAYDYAM